MADLDKLWITESYSTCHVCFTWFSNFSELKITKNTIKFTIQALLNVIQSPCEMFKVHPSPFKDGSFAVTILSQVEGVEAEKGAWVSVVFS